MDTKIKSETKYDSKCSECNGDFINNEMNQIALFGNVCNNCVDVVIKRRAKFCKLKWKAREIKSAYDLNMNLLLLASNMIRQLKKSTDTKLKNKFKNVPPFFRSPTQMAYKFTEDVLRHIPREYIKSSHTYEGYNRLFASSAGEFTLAKTIPVDVYVDALVKAKLVVASKGGAQ